ncbi:MAG: glycosyltransferase family 4 protein [Candidatus Methylacidiphilales bacterium]
MAKIRIIQIANSFGIGGRENVILNLCNNLSTEKFDIHLVLLSNDNNEQTAKLLPHVKVHILPFSERSFNGFKIVTIFIPLILLLRKKINHINPHVIHSHALFVWLVIICLAIKLSKAKVSHFHTVHTSGLYYSNKGFVNWIRLNSEKLALKLNDSIIIAISKGLKNNLNKIFKNKVELVYNGIDFKNFIPQTNIEIEKLINDRTVVTYLSRLDVGKNHLLLLEAWKKVVEINQNVVLFLIGDGKEREKIEKFIQKNSLQESVILFGNSNEVATILSYSHIAVFPSLFEGLPISLLEKMAFKLPVIVSDIDIFKEIIISDLDGLMFKQNSSDDLFEKINLVLNNKNLANKIAKNGFIKSQEFSIERMIRRHELLYLNNIR